MSITETKYKNKWKPHSLNEDFWREVMENRTINKITFDEDGVASMVLDSGEEVWFLGNSGRIKIEID